MKKLFFLPVLMAVVLVSCSDNVNFIPVLPQPNFNREIFNQEKQLWMEQNIQNYAFQQIYETPYTVIKGTTMIIQNGNVRFFRSLNGVSLHLPDGYGENLLEDMDLRISISELYAQIEQFANMNSYFIDIRYDSEYHFPVYVHCAYAPYLSAHSAGPPGTYYGSERYLYIENFVIDPEIPGTTSLAFNRDAFNTNRNKWAKQGNRNYVFTFSYDYYKPYDYFKPYPDDWHGIVRIKDGKLSEVIPSHSMNLTSIQPSGAAQAWIGAIDEVFAQIEKEAASYDGGGLMIEVTYDDTGYYPKEIRWLKTVPESPAEDSSYSVRIRLVTEDLLTAWGY